MFRSRPLRDTCYSRDDKTPYNRELCKAPYRTGKGVGLETRGFVGGRAAVGLKAGTQPSIEPAGAWEARNAGDTSHGSPALYSWCLPGETGVRGSAAQGDTEGGVGSQCGSLRLFLILSPSDTPGEGSQ